MKNENINSLDEINKGCYMGMDSINFILDKVEDNKLKKVLKNEYDKYKTISKKIEKIYSKYDSDGEPHKPSKMTEAMTWYGVEMKTIIDHSDSKIAELMLQGFNMGIIEGKKILNKKDLSREVTKIIDEYVSMQENSVEVLKQYL